MQIQVRGDHMEVTDALEDYAQKKLGRLERYFDAPPEKDVAVTMSVVGGLHRIEVTVLLHGVIFRAEEQSEDMYASIDLVVDKLEQQIARHKNKLNDRFRDQGLRTRIKASAENGAFARSFNDDELEHKVVRMKRFSMKPMDVEEAMLQMDLLGHDFFMFTNAETDEVNVIYRRREGNYGLIEPS
ncbi:ribosome hibernation-promoting factor, HPF/YfiA family [Alicyclobacillus sp. SO9]|uniref:ribosome hibernation-promoting factor, HPF/YfiA family n=1 Tax=Alicyclobacillus sp. SO9 TaxID=2665646 RepID=UPI0018E8E223|nr:ribosome-associated translation inhibitor RaiA [Alicyclobacillus sp. SO9]QQE78109.1 ribosome-associated translation inhibitor RaiA [Alicyclobacillus sp. SO9]